jgi:hypothetical protein
VLCRLHQTCEVRCDDRRRSGVRGLRGVAMRQGHCLRSRRGSLVVVVMVVLDDLGEGGGLRYSCSGAQGG